MKKKLQHCNKCGEETWHMIGRKQANSAARSYTRRTTCECMTCGFKEINNMKTGKRTFSRNNATPSTEVKDVS